LPSSGTFGCLIGEIVMSGKILHGLAVIAVAVSQWSSAAPVDHEDAEKVAASFVRTQVAPLSTAACAPAKLHTAGEATPITDPVTDETLAYVVNLQPEGFVVTSADTAIRPVIAHSLRGSFPADDDVNNVLLQMIRTDLKLRMQAAPFTLASVKESNEAQWADYATGGAAATTEAVTQYPPDRDGWLTTAWEQGSFYNDYCPIDPITGLQSLAGCVPVAMAQIVNYWQYPRSITFSSDDDYISSIDPNDDADDIPITAADANFVNIHYGNLSNDDIARLIFACGVLLHTQYSSASSNAHTVNMSQVLLGRLSYTCSPPIDGFIPFILLIKLRANMQNGQPAILAIQNGNGHTIVCDGYRDDETYHLNFGWGPSYPDAISQAWYALPADLPAGFSAINYGIVDILPPEQLPGDTNLDCKVDILDLVFVRNRLRLDVFSADNWRADFNGDSKIDVLDLIFVRNHLNTACGD